jgi:CelD/BcsL family acetyltransferase involved in cellulose biosynthesis
MAIQYHLEDPRTFDFAKADVFLDRSIHQTPAWLSFVAATQGAEPVVASLREGGETIGYFTGLIVRKFGLKVLGSPFPGWTTDYMGFNLVPGVSRAAALEGLRAFAFKTLGCVHVEVYDRHATEDDARAGRFDYRIMRSFEIDLRQDEASLFKSMTQACRNCVRKAEKSGVTIEEARDGDFARDYYAQLEDVFAKQALAPTYQIGRVMALIEHVLPSGNLLLLRARDKDGKCIATGIFSAFNGRMIYWGAASWREHQHLRPNEAIVWHAMRHWKARGVSFFDMGGGGEYKRRYGGYDIEVPWMRDSRYGAVAGLRNLAKTLVNLKQKTLGVAGQWRRS